MRVIIKTQGLLDFLFGVSGRYIDVPDEAVSQVVYHQDVY